MGVQSTRFITREKAEEMWVESFIERNREMIERAAANLTDDELQDGLESTFDNYMIVPEGEEE